MAEYEVPISILGQQVGTFLLQYGNIVDVKPRKKMGECHFNLTFNRKAFNTISNWLDVDGQKLALQSQDQDGEGETFFQGLC